MQRFRKSESKVVRGTPDGLVIQEHVFMVWDDYQEEL